MFSSRPGMHRRAFLSVITLLIVLLAGCDDDTVRPSHRADLGGYVYLPDGSVLKGASVYLAKNFMYFPSAAPVVVDSTLSDQRGYFAFDGLEGSGIRIYAGLWDRGGVDFVKVSPFSPEYSFEKTISPPDYSLRVSDVYTEGEVTGQAFYYGYNGEAPADSAQVILYEYRGGDHVAKAETRTTESGSYMLTDVRTGNYSVWASLTTEGEGPFPYYYSAETPPFFCNGVTLVGAPLLHLTDIAAEKPAIYIYPAEPGPHRVRLIFADRVRLTRSIPEYGDGWDVFIDQSGRIDRQWDYLFYEAAMSGSPLLRRGWCLDGEEMGGGLERIVRLLGLDDTETRDFLDYWLPRLPRRAHLVVTPLIDGDLDHLVRLRVDPAPDVVRRFWLLFSGSDRPVELAEPRIQPFVRRGGVLVEWGGAVVPRAPER